MRKSKREQKSVRKNTKKMHSERCNRYLRRRKIFICSGQNRSITRKGSQKGKDGNARKSSKNTQGDQKVHEKLGLIINTEIRDISVPSTFEQIVSEFFAMTVKIFSASYPEKKKKKKKKEKRTM